MLGLFAVVSEDPREAEHLDEALRALRPEPGIVVTQCQAAGGKVLLGRLSQGILNNQQPKASADGRYLAFIEGEIQNSFRLWKELGVSELNGKNDADLVLACTAKMTTTDWVRRCQGSFTVMIWDAQTQSLTFANDRFGLRPHYYAWDGRRLALGPAVRFILSFPWISKTLDMTSVTEHFAFQCILEDRTFFKDVSVLPYGSIMTLDIRDQCLNVERYWDFDQVPPRQEIDFREAVEHTATLLLDQVRVQTGSPHRYGLYLSGGLDSRLVLASLPKEHRTLHAFTFGLPNSEDHIHAAEMCYRTGAIHHRFNFTSGRWLEELAELHTRLTDGFQCLLHAHYLPIAPLARDLIDINLSGYYGETVVGGDKLVKHLVDGREDWSSLARNLYQQMLLQHGKACTTEYELRQFFTDSAWGSQERRPAWTSMEQALERFKAFRYENVTDYWHIVHRGRKMIQYFLVSARAYHEDREPFFGYDLFDFIYSLPVEYRWNRRLQIALLDRLAPDLATVPRTCYGELPTHRAIPRTAHFVRRKMSRWIHVLSGGHLLKPRNPYYEDYSRWLREELGDWVRSILLDNRTLNRGILNPAFLRSIVNQHLTGGEDCTWKIGLAVSFELMLRQFVD